MRNLLAAAPLLLFVAVLFIIDRPYPFVPTIIGALVAASATLVLWRFLPKRDAR